MLNEQLPDAARESVLVITTDKGDRLFLAAALESSMGKLHFAKDGSEARALLAAQFISVVIVDGDAQKPSWRELLEQFSGAEAGPGPRVIVVSRQVDERVWAEVLNLGGYDVLPKPLDADEVARAVWAAQSERSFTRVPARPGDIQEQLAWNAC